MKKNLSTEALKGFRKENGTTPSKRRNQDVAETKHNVPIQVVSYLILLCYSPSKMFYKHMDMFVYHYNFFIVVV